MIFWHKKTAECGKNKKKGFVILYAVLLTTVVLAIALTVAAIIAKQIYLAYVEKSYQTAYYAADAGRRCAFFWDGENGFWRFGQVNEDGTAYIAPDSTISPNIEFNNSVTGIPSPISFNQLYCSGQALNLSSPSSGPTGGDTNFSYNLNVGGGRFACVEVSVTKRTGSGVVNRTLITSNGYSVECDKRTSARSRTVQRTLELEY